MKEISDILKLAHDRASQLKLPYQGALTPSEAHALVTQNAQARIIDVRTRAELDWVGRIPGALEIEWNSWPGSQPNPLFLEQLRKQHASDAPALFICRSGARSHAAASAAHEAGFAACYNILEGFEGDKDVNAHRGNIGGWRHAGLPWTQS
ncbi:rhodanese-like domain-containing protein [Uliginosibacterium sediminicola]|uniref:Rhodanese-like domain-containing protein n=1 Tax=Uliginosibacterium sediminicola TaxID=2024550 RepID=A0ABU9YTE9_9RHOO